MRATMKTHIGQLAEIPATPSRPFAPNSDGRVERQIGKRVAMTQFGVNHLTLGPGAASSRRHWHEREDEFAYVLSGVVTLRDETGEHEIGKGGFVGFPAGAPNAHHLVNRGDAPVELLIVGTRKVGEERIHYPDEPDPGPFSVLRDEKGERRP